MSNGNRESRRKERWRKAETDISWVARQMLDRKGVDIIRLAKNRTLYHAVTSNLRI